MTELTMSQKYMTSNDCYKQNRHITPQGIMIHSTATPGVRSGAWFDRWNMPGVEKAVHSFIDDKQGFQYLPWTLRGWHCGSGPKGSGNNTHIAIELCEPGGFTYQNGAMVGYNVVKQTPYFQGIWSNAVALCVSLCREFNLTERNILCHSEGHALGIASNHADVMQWFPRHGKDMDDFRTAVKEALKNKETEEEPMTQEQFNSMMMEYTRQQTALVASDWANEAWDRAIAAGLLDGSAPHGPLTREQAALLLERLGAYGPEQA